MAVGSGVGIGVGEAVGSGVFNSMVGGASPTIGGSVVGRVENMPGGAEEVGSESSDPPQAISPTRRRATAAILKGRPSIPWIVTISDMFITHSDNGSCRGAGLLWAQQLLRGTEDIQNLGTLKLFYHLDHGTAVPGPGIHVGSGVYHHLRVFSAAMIDGRV